MAYSIKVLTWNICGDKQARADVADDVVGKEKPDIIVFQEARKTNPLLSNLYNTSKNFGNYEFLVANEYQQGGINYGGQNYYPDTTGKAYYAFYEKTVFANNPKPALTLVDYTKYLTGKGDSNADLLTTRRPAHAEFKHKASGHAVLLFTWHAPLSGAGGGVFNQAAHSFFATIADIMAKNKVAVIAGDMNASSKQVAKTYSNVWETGGNKLDHVLTNVTLKDSTWYDDAKSDVHYLHVATVEWT
jgi:endonuclease/exonuclease/phosphatase family metal-dependent hydrolase